MTEPQTALGIKCTPSQLDWVVLRGTKDEFVLVTNKTVKVPANQGHDSNLRWFADEARRLAAEHDASVCGLRTVAGGEGKAAYQRSEIEGVIIFVFGLDGRAIHRVSPQASLSAVGAKSNVAADAGVQAHPVLAKCPKTRREAMFAALVALRR